MHKKSKRTPKNHKNWHNTPIVLCWHYKFFESNKRQWISFRPKGGAFPTETIMLVVGSPGLWEAYTQTCPNWEFFYHCMLMLLHDSIPSFMNFRRVLDLLEVKNQVSQCLQPSDGGRVFKFIPIFCMGPKHAPKDTNLIFQPIYTHWGMCM